MRRHIEAARLMLYNKSVTCHVLLGNGRGPSIETLSFFAGKHGPSRGALAWRHPFGWWGASGFASEWRDFGASGMGLFFSEKRREY
jgi:hypothetical protein